MASCTPVGKLRARCLACSHTHSSAPCAQAPPHFPPHAGRYTFTRKGYEGLRKDVEKCLRNAHLLKVWGLTNRRHSTVVVPLLGASVMDIS